MSMLCQIARLPPTHVEAIRKDPTLVDDLLDKAPPPAKLGLLGRLLGRTPTPPPKPRPPPVAPADLLDLGKLWHILHYLFTGSAWEGDAPAAFLISGGTEIGPDGGYGPARLLDAASVAEIATFLAGLTPEMLARRYDPAAIAAAELYHYFIAPGAGDEEIATELAALWQTVVGVRDFFAETARRGDSVLVDIY